MIFIQVYFFLEFVYDILHILKVLFNLFNLVFKKNMSLKMSLTQNVQKGSIKMIKLYETILNILFFFTQFNYF